MTENTSYDYVICGGGHAGCVVASRLSQAGHSVILIEAGPEDYNEQVMSPTGAPHLHGSSFEYNIYTTEQPGLGGRSVPNHGGKLLSGSTGVNYGLWTRGHSVDYDVWAEVVGDERWSYKNMLPYFMKSETHYEPNGDPKLHGFTGPILTTAGARTYPLRETIKTAFASAGLEYNPDTNGGTPFGFGKFTENWKNGQRQPAGKAYDLSRAVVLTDSVVACIVFEGDGQRIAAGVTLANGSQYRAKKEVIICCGALKTPQLLMLSGIGPESELVKHGIRPIANLAVGENFHDHIAASIFWKLKNPERGLALGSPLFNKPEFRDGNPMEWIATISTPREKLVTAAEVDNIDEKNPYLSKGPRANAEVFACYAPIGGYGSGFHLVPDGTVIATPTVLLLPTSRGNLTLADTNPLSNPILDARYLQTETDREAMRTGIRLSLKIMETEAAREIVEGEIPPPGYPTISSTSTNAEIDRRLSVLGNSFYQNAGTASMGTVVDTQCRVKGVNNLRVCDASVIPLPIGGHYQAPMYAFAEAASDIILGDYR
jgi:choline dehydrogenase-like flavoprotein